MSTRYRQVHGEGRALLLPFAVGHAELRVCARGLCNRRLCGGTAARGLLWEGTLKPVPARSTQLQWRGLWCRHSVFWQSRRRPGWAGPQQQGWSGWKGAPLPGLFPEASIPVACLSLGFSPAMSVASGSFYLQCPSPTPGTLGLFSTQFPTPPMVCSPFPTIITASGIRGSRRRTQLHGQLSCPGCCVALSAGTRGGCSTAVARPAQC